MKILAIDPGTTESGVVTWHTQPLCFREGGKERDVSIRFPVVISNKDILDRIGIERIRAGGVADILAIEWIQSYGMTVGKSTFETCLWVGRFVEAAVKEGVPVRLIPRGAIKMHHCGSMRAKDGNVSQALRDKYGDKGTKKDPGFFFGVASHAWQACAVAAYVAEGAEDERELRF